jgi:hypothetical protein
MICFEVYINGQKVCLAGVGDDGVLSVMASFIASSESQRTDFRVGGLIKVDAEIQQQVEWIDREVNVGDDITIKIVESENYDTPMNGRTQYLQCSFCRKKQEEVSKLIAGSNNYICNECVVSYSQVITEGANVGNISLFEAETNPSCSFCGKQFPEVEKIVGFEENRICNDCIDICQEIINADND